jgi:hypothetical protein
MLQEVKTIQNNISKNSDYIKEISCSSIKKYPSSNIIHEAQTPNIVQNISEVKKLIEEVKALVLS